MHTRQRRTDVIVGYLIGFLIGMTLMLGMLSFGVSDTLLLDGLLRGAALLVALQFVPRLLVRFYLD